MANKFKIFVLSALATVSIAATVDIYSDITQAILDANAKAISKYFSSNVEMIIDDQENVYSKTQAEQVLREFFAKNKPSGFKIIHRGISKEGAKYAIGKLSTEQGLSYRTYFYVKNQKEGEFIQEIRFEKE